jgi:KUP system potassium uptake protein
VFGDIGTSPLYTFKTVLGLTGANPDPIATLGALSLVIWTLIVVTSIKYVSFAMRGGILALMSLLGVKGQHRPVIVAVGLFGAALIYGDGAITPAISVLSALEGLDIVTSTFRPYILPGAVVILLALFTIQPLGTTRIGGPVWPESKRTTGTDYRVSLTASAGILGQYHNLARNLRTFNQPEGVAAAMQIWD